jgi:hypothetical protein
VLGATDGIVSTASLIVGVAGTAATQSDVLSGWQSKNPDEANHTEVTEVTENSAPKML